MNADVIDGSIADSTSLNLYTYVNGNPISFVDPFGMSADRGNNSETGNNSTTEPSIKYDFDYSKFTDPFFVADTTVQTLVNKQTLETYYNNIRNSIISKVKPNNIGTGTWAKYIDDELKYLDDLFGEMSGVAKTVDSLPYISIIIDTGIGIAENINAGTSPERIASDAVVDVGIGLLVLRLGDGIVTGAGVGGVPGAVIGAGTGIVMYIITDAVKINDKPIIDHIKDGVSYGYNKVDDWCHDFVDRLGKGWDWTKRAIGLE